MKLKTLVLFIIAGVIGVLTLICLLSGIAVVNGGTTGVVKKLGNIQEEPLSEGVHFVTPFITSVVEIDNKVQRTDVEGESASKDLQTIKTNTSINYQILPDKSVYIYRTIGEDILNVILRPAAQESVKSIIASYTAEECITKRQEISDNIKRLLNQKVESYGITIRDFNILNFGFSDEFNKAIEAKQTAQQNALKAQQDFERIKVENQQKVAQAEAEAQANALKNQQITDKILKNKFLEKWNGELPKVVDSGSNILDLSNLAQ